MTEHEKREKVIKGMEYCIDYAQRIKDQINDVPCQGCPYSGLKPKKVGQGDCMDTMLQDAITLLKAQKPRVMTWQEIIDTATQMPFIWLESKEKNDRVFQSILFKTWLWDSMATIITVMTQGWLFEGHQVGYGKTWRCWTSRPTDAQREAVKWE